MENYYRDLSWGALYDTPAYKANTTLNQVRIKKTPKLRMRKSLVNQLQLRVVNSRKLLLIVFLSTFCCAIANGQRQDDNIIYSSILEQFEFNTLLQKKIITKTLKRFNFKEPATHWEPYQHIKLTTAWRSFLSDVDTSKIREGNLTNTLIAKYPHKPENDRDLNFSPIIYSKDKKMAVCAVSVLGPHSSNEEVFLYEKKNGKWVKIKAYLIEMT